MYQKVKQVTYCAYITNSVKDFYFQLQKLIKATKPLHWFI